LRPLRATWPDAAGRFTLVYPGRLVSPRFFELHDYFFARSARPGGEVVISSWPRTLPAQAVRGVAGQ
jgi:hypothetical protein